MPNGGTHHCGYCLHFERDTSMCALRGVKIDLVHWTTCRNHRYKSKNLSQSDVEPVGPLYAIVCEVKDNTGGYEMIPYFKGNRVDTVQKGGGDTIVCFTDSEGVRHEFPGVEDYLSFYGQHSTEE